MSLREATTTRLGYVFQYPADLAVTAILAVVAYYTVMTVEPGSELRVLVAVPLVLFLPGYALVSVLFPARKRVASGERGWGIDVAERLGLALALSIALVPLAAIALALSSQGFTTETVAVALAAFTVVVSQLGVVRRLRVPHGDRFSFSSIRIFEGVRGEGTLATASTLLLVLAVAVSGAAFAFAFVSPGAAGGFTELGIYTEDDGELVAGGFPSTVEPGESIPFVIEVENQEGDARTYTAVVQQQVIDDDEVVDRTNLETATLEADDGEAVRAERTVTPTVGEGPVRIVVLLYEDEPPAEPTRENAAEDAFFWVEVTADEASGGGDLEVDDDAGEGTGVGDDADDGDLFDDEELDESVDTILDGVEDGIDAIQDGTGAVGDALEDD